MTLRSITDYEFGLMPTRDDPEQFITYAIDRGTGEILYRASNIASYLDYHLNKVNALKKTGNPVMLGGVYYANLRDITNWLVQSKTGVGKVATLLGTLEKLEKDIAAHEQLPLPLGFFREEEGHA